MRRYRLARMSPVIRVLTVVLLILPAAFLTGMLTGRNEFVGPFVVISVIYAWVWFLFRPGAFVIHPDALEVVWPLKRREVSRQSILSVRQVDAKTLRTEIGWGARVGAGGLWGGFGWLWTKRRGVVQMYISRTDQFVWIERGHERPWLVTPERPDEFVHELSPTGSSVTQQSPACDVANRVAHIEAHKTIQKEA